jgi:hypothetical protein
MAVRPWIFLRKFGGRDAINVWGINNHIHASCPINFSNKTTSIELGIDKVALPIVRVIAAVEGLDLSATSTLLKKEDSSYCCFVRFIIFISNNLR